MKVIDIIDLTAKLLNEFDVKNCISYCKKNNMTITNLFNCEGLELDYYNEQSIKDLRLILDTINIVLIKIATENRPIVVEEEVTSKNGKIAIDTLSQKLFKIKEISCGGVKQNYSISGGNILVSDGIYTIKYAIIPTELDFESSFNDYYGKLSLLTVCYGVCSYYTLIKGMYDESDMWKEKFENALNQNFAKLGGIYVKSRRWF